jgi:hypothetical protein
MVRSLDNSNGIQYYGGNDPKKMSGRFKKGGSVGGKAKLSGSLRSLIEKNKGFTDNVAARISNGNKKLANNPTGGKTFEGGLKNGRYDSTIRRQKRAMTSDDISRNAGIQSARLERQGQLNLLR